MNKQPFFSIVSVNYQSKHALLRCFDSFFSFFEKEGISFEWIVVNNSKEEVFDVQHPNLFFLTQEENIGFGKACNTGVRKAKGDIVWFVNPDTQYKKGTLQQSLQLLKKASVVGHQLIDEKQDVKTVDVWKKIDNREAFFAKYFSIKEISFLQKRKCL